MKPIRAWLGIAALLLILVLIQSALAAEMVVRNRVSSPEPVILIPSPMPMSCPSPSECMTMEAAQQKWPNGIVLAGTLACGYTQDKTPQYCYRSSRIAAASVSRFVMVTTPTPVPNQLVVIQSNILPTITATPVPAVIVVKHVYETRVPVPPDLQVVEMNTSPQPPPVDAEAVVQTGLHQSYQDENQDLRNYSDLIKQENEAKGETRESIEKIRSCQSALRPALQPEYEDIPVTARKSMLESIFSFFLPKTVTRDCTTTGCSADYYCNKSTGQCVQAPVLIVSGTVISQSMSQDTIISDKDFRICDGAGETFCGNGCKYLKNDPLNCGSCGNRCDKGQSCLEGSCRTVCPQDRTECKPGTCVDLKTDSRNCGICNNLCSQDEECINGGCINTIQQYEDKLNSVGNDSQLANVDLQNVLQKQQQMILMMGNVSKMFEDTAMAVIRKIG